MKPIYRISSRLGIALVLLFLLASAIPSALRAQVGRLGTYQVTTFQTSLSSITGIGSYSVNGDDSYNTTLLPFNFNYDGVAFNAGTTVYLYDNGYMTLGVYNSPTQYSSTVTGSTYKNQIDVFQADMYINNGIYYATTGSAPNRIYTVEWNTMRGYSGNGLTTTMQVKLYESSNVIEFWYAQWGYNLGNYAASGVGLAGGTTSPFNNIVVNSSTTSTPGANYRFAPPILTDAELTSSPKVMNFGSVGVGNSTTLNATIQNLGVTSTMTVKSITLAGSPDFTIMSAPANNSTLGPGASATITIKFAPSTTGTLTGNMTIVTDGRDSGTQTIGLTATGLAPLISVDTNILFKKTLTKMGTSQVGRVLITSSGQAPLFFTSFPLSGIDADQYAIIHTPATPLAPGQVDSLLVRYTPTREGRRVATLTINSTALNTPALPIQLIGTGVLPHIVITPSPVLKFDSVAIGDSVCKTVSIWNPGTDTLLILANQQTGGDADYHYYGLAPGDSIIPPDRTKLVNICFTPRQRGERVARIAFRTNIIATFEQPPRDTASLITLDVQGTGVPFGAFSQSASGGNILDSSIVGMQVCATDTIYNVGQSDITITGMTIGGTNASEFLTSGITLPYLLKAGSKVALSICSTPSQRGIRTASVTITGKTNDRTLTLAINARTLGLLTCLQPSPISLFGGFEIYRGSDTTLCDTVTNCGDVAAVYTATISGQNASDYTVTPGTSLTVAPGATAVFCVQYHPTVTGQSPATMTVSAANTQSQTVSLGGAACCAHLAAEAFAIPKTGAGGHVTFTVTIDNSGGCDWNAGTLLIEGDTSAFHLSDVGTIAGNGNKQVTIHYDPSDINHTYTARISFPNGGPCQDDTLALDLSQTTDNVSVPMQSEQDGFVLTQNRPNPFETSTSFSYRVPTEAPISLTLSDMTGRIVRTITTGSVSAGEHTVILDAQGLASGTYILSLRSGSVALTSRVVLQR